MKTPMKSPFLAAALLLLAGFPAAAQMANGVIMVSAEQVEQIRQSARAAQAASTPGRPSISQPIITAQPYALNLEHRTGKAPASQHPVEAEVIMVLDGAGTITTGGALVNATTAANGNISGSDIANGTPRHVVKGDMLMVPQNTPHMMVPDGVLVLATLHLPRTSEPAPVPGRAPAAPKLVNLAADLPAMTEKASRRGNFAALLRRRHDPVPAALSRGAGIPFAQRPSPRCTRMMASSCLCSKARA